MHEEKNKLRKNAEKYLCLIFGLLSKCQRGFEKVINIISIVL